MTKEGEDKDKDLSEAQDKDIAEHNEFRVPPDDNDKPLKDNWGLRKRRFIVTVGGGGILLLAVLVWMVFKP